MAGLHKDTVPAHQKGRAEVTNRALRRLNLQKREIQGQEVTQEGSRGATRRDSLSTNIDKKLGHSLVVQRVGLRAFTAMGQGSIPGQGTKIVQVTWHGQKKKSKGGW